MNGSLVRLQNQVLFTRLFLQPLYIACKVTSSVLLSARVSMRSQAELSSRQTGSGTARARGTAQTTRIYIANKRSISSFSPLARRDVSAYTRQYLRA